ncbi:CzcE family metal-binding protein [Glaciimonas sp. Gout2]|uniref:CzcE family metal-binding protein n=1 Tax=unclassified Glaciimonas TaxID=2644401 RepID=UPI002AB52AF5|nr:MULTISPECIES: CzcE family metal-binding protein [unclassified Glaciimonas]MDY7545297.1 CzcE family metal-binding protein [Glaciimonas sp. CA11.2]MEB0013832.1 CzcE family metal-binding protein [Glaciimonas sp. Cout2]MEB0083065.1 CzcE family metal-binding protein [Glaciimonas sp. Gout2]
MSNNSISALTAAGTLRTSLLASILAIACSSSFAAELPLKFLGDPGTTGTATQTINIKPDTKYVNVTGGQTVKFVVGDKSFAWYFDVGTNVSTFDLNRVAPANILTQPIKVYVAQDVTSI